MISYHLIPPPNRIYVIGLPFLQMSSRLQFRAVQTNCAVEKYSNAKFRTDQRPCYDSRMRYRKGNAEAILGRNSNADYR